MAGSCLFFWLPWHPIILSSGKSAVRCLTSCWLHWAGHQPAGADEEVRARHWTEHCSSARVRGSDADRALPPAQLRRPPRRHQARQYPRLRYAAFSSLQDFSLTCSSTGHSPAQPNCLAGLPVTLDALLPPRMQRAYPLSVPACCCLSSLCCHGSGA